MAVDAKGTGAEKRPPFRLDACTSPEVAELLRDPGRRTGIILPVGCIEQHGPLLPLGCDMFIARRSAEALAGVLGDHGPYRALVAPDMAYTPSPGAEHTPGTVSVSFDCLGQGLMEVLRAAMRTPWAFVVVLNAHAHNHGRVIEASMAGADGSLGKTVPVLALNVYQFADICRRHGLEPGSHGGEFEIALHAFFGGTVAAGAPSSQAPAKEKPAGIFGLPLMERSRDGVIAPGPPDVARALGAAKALGADVVAAMREFMVTNLDVYFRYWEDGGASR